MVNVEVKEGQAPDVTPDITTSIAIIRWVFPIFVGGLSVQILSLAGKTPCLVLQMFHDMMSIYIYNIHTPHVYLFYVMSVERWSIPLSSIFIPAKARFGSPQIMVSLPQTPCLHCGGECSCPAILRVQELPRITWGTIIVDYSCTKKNMSI